MLAYCRLAPIAFHSCDANQVAKPDRCKREPEELVVPSAVYQSLAALSLQPAGNLVDMSAELAGMSVGSVDTRVASADKSEPTECIVVELLAASAAELLAASAAGSSAAGSSAAFAVESPVEPVPELIVGRPAAGSHKHPAEKNSRLTFVAEYVVDPAGLARTVDFACCRNRIPVAAASSYADFGHSMMESQRIRRFYHHRQNRTYYLFASAQSCSLRPTWLA